VTSTEGRLFHWEGLAIAAGLSDVRRAIQEWGERVGLPAGLVGELALATYEAMANAVEHAYAGVAPGGVSVLVSESPGWVEVVVADQGKWHEPAARTGFRGRGLLLIKGLAEEMTVSQSELGTTVRMRWRLD
jgi:serine/threonine-protein kinase RsbW